MIGKLSNILPILILALTQAWGQDWDIQQVATGTKPQIDLDSQGNPHISYIHQSANGWVRYAVWNPLTMTFDTATVNDGNFEGPPAITLDQNDIPHLCYHRHTPPPEQIHAYFTASGWVNEDLTDPNHDGWDNSLAFDSANLPRTSSIDPSSFPGSTGVEYAYYDGSIWHVEVIGSSLINYFGGTSLVIDSQDDPHITYYDDLTDDLMYAVKDGGTWSITPIDTTGDSGRFSSMELNSLDQPCVSYYQHVTGGTGVVKLAEWDGAAWAITIVDTLDSVAVVDARQITSLELDSQDIPHLSYGDQRVVRYAVRVASSWQSETVIDVTGSSTILGQVTSLGLAENGKPHIVYYETGTIGTIRHATKPVAPAQLSASPLALDFGQVVIGSTDTLSVLVQNVGQETLSITNITVDEPSFFVVPPISFALMGQDTHRVFVQFTASPPPGVHSGTMTFVSNDPVAPTVVLDGEAVDVTDVSVPGSPLAYKLLQNWPNPFNPATMIALILPEQAWVSLKIYDVLGQEIITLLEEERSPGEQNVIWDGRNRFGVSVGGGMYVYRLRVSSIQNRMVYEESGKMLLLK